MARETGARIARECGGSRRAGGGPPPRVARVMSALMVAARGAVSAGRPSSLPTANGARVTGALRHRPTLRRLVAVMCERLPPCARACATFSPRYACIARMTRCSAVPQLLQYSLKLLDSRRSAA